MYIVLENYAKFLFGCCHELVNIKMLGARLKSCRILWNSNVLDYVFLWVVGSIFWKMSNHVKIIHAIKVDNDVKYRAVWC